MGAGIKLGVGSRSSGSGGGSVGLQFPSNANISASLQAVSDKSGTASPLYLSTTQVASVFSGTGEKETYSHVLTHADADGLGAFQAVYTDRKSTRLNSSHT